MYYLAGKKWKKAEIVVMNIQMLTVVISEWWVTDKFFLLVFVSFLFFVF